MGVYDIYDRSNNSYYDHEEVYYTKDKKHVIISSPYVTHNNWVSQKLVTDFYNERGFELYNQLYNTQALTFIRIM